MGAARVGDSRNQLIIKEKVMETCRALIEEGKGKSVEIKLQCIANFSNKK